MAKSTHDGPSYSEEELADPNPPEAIRRFQLGDDRPSVGDSSSQSSPSESQPSANESSGPPSPVQMTESRLGNPPEEEIPSTAPLTAGDGQTTDQAPSVEALPYERWKKADLQEECRKRKLSTSGTIPELADRLYDYDEATEVEVLDEEE